MIVEHYTEEQLTSIYELGRMYYEMGYYSPAERIFQGLAVIDRGITAAQVGLGLIKLERGLLEESMAYFKAALQSSRFAIQAKLGLAASFVGTGEMAWAKQLLVQVAQELEAAPDYPSELRALWEALALRCESARL